jgi:hypothetical protein
MTKPQNVLAAAFLVGLVALSWVGRAAECCEHKGTDTAAAKPCAEPAQAQPAQIAKDWGIELVPLRLSAHGYMIDFRYKVLDPEKAAALADRELKPYLIDQKTGTKLQVPKTPKVGPMRQTAVKVTAGRTYSALFSNSGQIVKSGSKVTVVIGDCRLENLTVE